MTRKLVAWFLVAQLLAGGFVFREALIGRALLAPLDILPAIFTEYGYMDPASSGVPANHQMIDQVIYDLPLQHVIHASWNRGEVPWWDPFTLGGRPLLADAHINATDPVRVLLYHLLPFKAAYNWTRLTHYMLCGLGMLCLLLRLGMGGGLALWLSIGYEFSGAFACPFGHPWIQGSFVYYPFLWLAWDRACSGRIRAWAIASVLVAAVFYAGNLQSHTYLVIFAFAFACGFSGRRASLWARSLLVTGATGVLGAMLAAPVLGTELELFSLNVRDVGGPFNPLAILSGPASLAAFYPWCLGTFRSLDLSKLLERGWHLGFAPFIGCASFVLAMIGMAPMELPQPRATARRTAILLCIAYVVIISTPLDKLLYMRCVPLAALGLTVLAALGFERLMSRRECWQRLGLVVGLLAVGAALATNIFAAFVYPHFKSRIEQFVLKRTVHNPTFLEAPALRLAQVQALPREISFLNPESVLGFASLMALTFFLRNPQWRSNRWACGGVLMLNLLPVLWFSSRYLPRQPVAIWDRLLAGGPEQQRIAQQFNHKPWRLAESTPELRTMIFPASLAALQQVKTIEGYCALKPLCLGTLPRADHARWCRDLQEPLESRGPGLALSRLRWDGPTPRAFSLEEPALSRLHLILQPGAPGKLLWFDTAYPGWHATIDGQPVRLQPVPPCFSALEVSAASRASEINLHYEPTYLSVGCKLALLGIATCSILVSWEAVQRWKTRPQSAPQAMG